MEVATPSTEVKRQPFKVPKISRGPSPNTEKKKSGVTEKKQSPNKASFTAMNTDKPFELRAVEGKSRNHNHQSPSQAQTVALSEKHTTVSS